jgi:hypothetical protein
MPQQAAAVPKHHALEVNFGIYLAALANDAHFGHHLSANMSIGIGIAVGIEGRIQPTLS